MSQEVALSQDTTVCQPASFPAGTLLHFEDHGLKNIYFLDPQWLAKFMADVIRSAAIEKGSLIQNGQSALPLLSMCIPTCYL